MKYTINSAIWWKWKQKALIACCNWQKLLWWRFTDRWIVIAFPLLNLFFVSTNQKFGRRTFWYWWHYLENTRYSNSISHIYTHTHTHTHTHNPYTNHMYTHSLIRLPPSTRPHLPIAMEMGKCQKTEDFIYRQIRIIANAFVLWFRPHTYTHTRTHNSIDLKENGV